MAKILAIESDPERIVILRRLIREKLDADVIVADSVESAIDTLDAKRPDVIVTSSLLSFGDDQQLADHLRQAPALDHLPVLTLPPLVDTDDEASSRGLLSRLFRRRRQSWRTYDADAIAARIEDALLQSKRDAPKYADLWQRPARLLLGRNVIRRSSTANRPQPRGIFCRVLNGPGSGTLYPQRIAPGSTA